MRGTPIYRSGPGYCRLLHGASSPSRVYLASRSFASGRGPQTGGGHTPAGIAPHGKSGAVGPA